MGIEVVATVVVEEATVVKTYLNKTASQEWVKDQTNRIKAASSAENLVTLQTLVLKLRAG